MFFIRYLAYRNVAIEKNFLTLLAKLRKVSQNSVSSEFVD